MTDRDRAKSPLKIGVLLSGSGTNLQAIIDAIAADELDAQIVLVVSSRPDAYGINRAIAANIPIMMLNRAMYDDPEAADAMIAAQLKQAGAEYVVMAGYMRKVTPVLLGEFEDRVLNLHPALLPSFQGAHAIQDAFDYGVKVTGVTVHLANEEYDKGPIVAQRPVAVPEGCSLDELEESIHAIEHELYPWVIQQVAMGRLSVDDEGHAHLE